ncbi:hypothetical protein FPV67DRAFT_303414 [Lyophyllum atratum]|nr:hypothetical protein FPV67DRAFT_303414 [Lyophyllum atratum]
MNRATHPTQHSLQGTEQSIGLKTMCRLGKFLGIKTGYGAPSSSASRKPDSGISSPKPNSSFNHFLSAVPIPSSSFSCAGDGESSTSSDATFIPNGADHRPVRHSVSAPTMCNFYQSHSEASTRSPSPVNTTPLPVMLSLRALPLPAEEETKKSPVSIISPKPDGKRRWRWGRRKEEKSPLPIHSTIPPTSDPEKLQSIGRTASPLWKETFEPTPHLSSIFPSLPADDLQLTPITSASSTFSDDLQYREKPSRKHTRRQSINKLARTLGVFPNDFNSHAETGKSPYNADSIGKSTQNSTKEHPRRRIKLSLTTKLNTLPAVLRPPSTPTPSRSRISLLSTPNTDDVHRFGLADDLSESWGNSRAASVYSSSSPISPITFKPPTPVAVAAVPRRASLLGLNLLSASADKLKHPDEVTRPSSSSSLSPPSHLSATLSRSRSLSFAPPAPRIGRLARLASAHSAASSRPHTPTPVGEAQEPHMPVKANWLEGPVEAEVEKAKSFVDEHPEYADEYRTWSGQWNQDDMQHVIRMLRNLK